MKIHLGQKGFVFWITGLSGSGKTTISKSLYDHLIKSCSNLVLLDGDVIRELFGHDLGHNQKDRLINANRISRLCWFLSEQGIHVICATMSLFKECHQWNRKNISNYREILIDVPLEVLKQRDSKGIYSRAQSGSLSDVVGLDIEGSFPENPDLIIKNDQRVESFQTIVNQIVDLMK